MKCQHAARFSSVSQGAAEGKVDGGMDRMGGKKKRMENGPQIL